nr:YraN family protein [Vibrio stylophorae]
MPLWKRNKANPPHNKRSVGDFYEALACQYLTGQGLLLLERNYQCQRGEVDLIMQDPQQQIVFVEVKYRQSERFGGAHYALTPSKQQKLLITAQHWLLQRGYDPHQTAYRFDYVAINGKQAIDWLTNVIAEG